ncbi:multicopper oxidase domain-containing protein [Streptomyces rubiginosohelvolus]
MRTPPKLSDLVARRGFLIGAGVAGAGAALGTGLALPRKPGRPAPGPPGRRRPGRLRGGGGEGPGALPGPLPVPRVISGRKGELTVTMRSARVRLHRSLPYTRLRTYEGTHVGPTIEAKRGSRRRIAWENDLSGAYPLPAVRVPFAYDPELPLMWDRPGREGAAARADVAELPPWAVVHLHGAVTGGGNDGWAENAVLPGAAQLAEYPNDQPAAGLWYHDHATHITHLNVMTGLGAGAYLIRDEEERRLRLPTGDREIPLVFFDRNLDLDDDGAFTGDLLYKGIVVADDPYELVRPFTGPFNLVNGVIWPHLDVEAGQAPDRRHRPDRGRARHGPHLPAGLRNLRGPRTVHRRRRGHRTLEIPQPGEIRGRLPAPDAPPLGRLPGAEPRGVRRQLLHLLRAAGRRLRGRHQHPDPLEGERPADSRRTGAIGRHLPRARPAHPRRGHVQRTPGRSDRTLIVIAHREATIRRLPRIIRLDENALLAHN